MLIQVNYHDNQIMISNRDNSLHSEQTLTLVLILTHTPLSTYNECVSRRWQNGILVMGVNLVISSRLTKALANDQRTVG